MSIAGLEDIWVPLVDEPIGTIVEQIQREHPEIDNIVDSPRKVLAFRTFAYIRVGLKLGQMLFDHDLPAYDGTETWVDALLRDPTLHDELVQEVKSVAREVAADPALAEEEALGPDDDARARFRAFARERLQAL
jgi:hypothetical protein